eukprot:5521346-Pyramimonas_sp.AAC.1
MSKRADSEADGSSKRQRVLTVLTCSACLLKSNSSGVTWADTFTAKGTGTKWPKGPARSKCWGIYNGCFSHLGYFEEVAQMKNDKEVDVGEHWAIAEGVIGGDAKDFIQTDVVASSCNSIDIDYSLVGLTKAEFKSHFGKTPEECDIKLRDLPRPNGSMFKGVLLRNPMAPWVTCAVKSTRGVSSKRLELEASQQKFEQQAVQISRLKIDEMEKDKLVTAMRNCT